MNDDMKFIYVFDEDSYEVLLKRGFRVLKKSEDSGITVFENKDEYTFDNMPDCKCVFSNVLTF